MSTTDSIALTGLRVRAHHGVFDFERENGQDFIVDLLVRLDLGPAARGDELAATVHYGELAQAVHDAVAADPVDLIETVAERIARVALGFEAAEWVRVTVHKPDAPIAVPFADVAVTVERDREWFRVTAEGLDTPAAPVARRADGGPATARPANEGPAEDETAARREAM